LKVRHHRYFEAGSDVSVIDGPALLEFNSKLKNRYLIFLKRTEGGLFEPLTGQQDPGNSFLLLKEYHVSRERRVSEPPPDGQNP
jgi:hypothetical protein